MINRADSNDIICIGTTQGVEVNFYMGAIDNVPTIELLGDTGRITLRPAVVQDVVDLLQETEQFWMEEGRSL